MLFEEPQVYCVVPKQGILFLRDLAISKGFTCRWPNYKIEDLNGVFTDKFYITEGGCFAQADNCKKVSLTEMITIIVSYEKLKLGGHHVKIGDRLEVGCSSFDWKEVQVVVDKAKEKGYLK